MIIRFPASIENKSTKKQENTSVRATSVTRHRSSGLQNKENIGTGIIADNHITEEVSNSHELYGGSNFEVD